VFDNAGPRLRVVANVAVGYDNIDVAAATARGITVCNTPGVLDETTADLAFLLLLAAARLASDAERDLRNGDWPGWTITQYLGVDIHGATLGVVGFGRIGQAVGRRAAGFGMQVLHHTRRDTGSAGWTADLDGMLAASDFVSLHVPLTPATTHLIDARRLALMKPTAVLVNTSRGPVVDEAALADALHDGRIFAAGIDVYEHEPEVHPRLLTAPRAVLLPHLGSASRATRTRMAHLACEGVIAVLAGDIPPNLVHA
jgi:glyoxylate reductase